ncbi:MAG: hypothetical protein B7C54_04505 [Acidimicrobiales bacterium mtb01]|nr:hypothetical protein [Actinomycetota bacterium]TEX46482.1 MAG: hypothetical protein B7C54_04505 [Acidimicrobiales bacterium mtb01]
MSIENRTSSTGHKPRVKHPVDPEVAALFIEGVIENAEESLEWAELGDEASWEALQIVDPEPFDLDWLVWPTKK